MLANRFVRGLDAVPLETFPGLFQITDLRRPNSYRFACTYADGVREKERFFAFLARAGQAEKTARWHLHHVVEGHHFADIDFEGRLGVLYASELPCVFILDEEHDAYTRQARLRGTKEMYRDPMPRRMEARSRAARAGADAARTDPALLANLRAQVMKLRRYYRDLHEGDVTFQTITDNVFSDVLDRLGDN